MQFIKISFIILLVVYLCVFLYFCHKNGKFFKTLLLSCLSGLLTFTIVNLLSHFTGVNLPVNAWTTGTSALFGIPGVFGLLTVRMFF